ncbi:MAG: hypothetical protein IJ560_01995 [Alphaproteobacteria bacterium]|nr:hypothetical protein [Alphaproteobacteria bacterium]
MSRLKKFLIVFMSFMPFAAGALAPVVVALVGGIAAIAGFSIYRTNFPVDMAGALKFFSTCWSCHMFSDVMAVMSNAIPGVYHAIGLTVIPFAAGLTAVWFAWKLLSGYFNQKIDDPWNTAGSFGTMLIKLTFVSALLMAPLPRMLTSIAIEPIFNIGLSINHVVGDTENFNTCVVATAIADQTSIDSHSASRGAFSPKLRHNLACELADIHKITALGMTTGWTMLNMAFDSQYMHKIIFGIPIFPNVPVFFAGLTVLALFFMALLPIPMYFLETFIKLSLDLIMLPLMLLSWLFQDWKIFPQGKKNIRKIIDDVVQGTVGIAMTCVMLIFMLMFLDAVAGGWNNTGGLLTAIEQNDSSILMDGLMMQNDSLVTMILMGLFFFMFMSMIPALVKTFFNVQVSDEFYNTAKKNINGIRENVNKWRAALKK